MEITKIPVILVGLQKFIAEQATIVLQRFLPDRSFDSHPTMIATLVHTFKTTPQELCQSALQKFDKPDFEVQTTIADWLNICGILRHQYARSISSSKSKADGLFIWLAVHCTKQHLNLIHASGIWTSCKSEYVVTTDPAIVLLILGFLSVTKMGTVELLDDCVFLAQFKYLMETQDHYIPVPQVLNKPVLNLGSWLEEIGIYVCGDHALLYHIMAQLFDYAPNML